MGEISRATRQEITCETCKRTWEAEVWVLIDIAERPDLFAMCRNKASIRAFLCPHCHTFMWTYFPLMLYYPSKDRVVFVADRAWPDSAIQDMAANMAVWLSISLNPNAGRDELEQTVRRYLESAIVLNQLELMMERVPLP